jgi:DNA-binding transcriptional ArsR family regulator
MAKTRSLSDVAAIIKCLGHPLRLLLLDALVDGERTVTELQEATGEAQATVSRQLAIMRGRDVVDSRRDGVNVYYRIVEPRVHTILECIRGCRLTD